MVHTITIAPSAPWLGTEQVRDRKTDGDRLTLSGTALVEPARRGVPKRRRRRG